MSIAESNKDHLDELPSALMNFQFLEESLKQYLGRSHVMISTVVKPFLTYSVSPASRLESWPLGKLIEAFADFNDNQDLLRNLRKLPKIRNFIAHQAYVSVSGVGLTNHDVEEVNTMIKDAINSSEACIRTIWAEIEILEKHFVSFRRR